MSYVDFNKHSQLEGMHAYLSPSQYHWIRYDEDKLEEHFENRMNAMLGVKYHDLANKLIELRVPLPEDPDNPKTLNLFVNHAIGFRMRSEQMLYYSEFCYGTADAIQFRRNILRIFDLKMGKNKASFDQLLVYAALFCLEYGFMPFDIEYDLRLYQHDQVYEMEVDPSDIVHIMDKIKTHTKRLRLMKEEAGL